MNTKKLYVKQMWVKWTDELSSLLYSQQLVNENGEFPLNFILEVDDTGKDNFDEVYARMLNDGCLKNLIRFDDQDLNERYLKANRGGNV